MRAMHMVNESRFSSNHTQRIKEYANVIGREKNVLENNVMNGHLSGQKQ